jgi:small subunit ribosomal protein S2
MPKKEEEKKEEKKEKKTKKVTKKKEDKAEIEKKVEAPVKSDLLVPIEKYLEAGVHIGSRFRSGNMKRFIYKCRSDGVCVLDVAMLDNRIATAAEFISRVEPEKVLVVTGRTYAKKPADKFASLIGAKCIIGRFVPGTLTNPGNPKFIEPKLIFTSDPGIDRQVIKEAVVARIPVVSMCGTNDSLRNVDVAVPVNNKGKKSLALIYWLLAREVLKKRGDIKTDKSFTAKIEDFETKIEERKPKDDVDKRFGGGRWSRKRKR